MAGSDQALYIVDDDDAVRDSLEALFMASDYNIRTFGTATEFLESYEPNKIQCLLLDVRMPDANGIEVLEQLAEKGELPATIIITGHGDVTMAVHALKVGAFDFVEKPFVADGLIERVAAAVRWGQDQKVERLKASDAREHLDTLTPREQDVMRQLVIGNANKVIARELGLSPRTVEIHRARVMEKTGADSLSHLVRMALAAGYEPDA